jgi:hypothetical protein
MKKELSERVQCKIENGVLLEGDELTELVNYNEEFVERKRQLIMVQINKIGGL